MNGEFSEILEKIASVAENKKYLNSCPYTKKSVRNVELEINLENFCDQHGVDYENVDADVFPENRKISIELEKECGTILLMTRFGLIAGKSLWLAGIYERLEKPGEIKTKDDVYTLMRKEDEFAEKQISKLLLAFLLEKRCAWSAVEHVNDFAIFEYFGKGFTTSTELKSCSKELCSFRASLSESIERVFDDLLISIAIGKEVRPFANKERWVKYAKEYATDETKKKSEKKSQFGGAACSSSKKEEYDGVAE